MTTIKLHKAQSEPLRYLFGAPSPEDWKMRFALVVGSRGFGKSFLAGGAATLGFDELEKLDASIPNKNITIVCGTHTQVTDVYYPLLAYQFGLESFASKSSRHSGRFEFPNNTAITLWSADAIERMRGKGNYLVIADEITSWPTPGTSLKSMWEDVIEPTIVTRWSGKQALAVGAPSPGRGLVVSTPTGKDYFYDLAMREIEDDSWKTFKFTYRDSPLLSIEEIEKIKRRTDPISFAREYEASFEESGLSVFYCFRRDLHVNKNLEYFDPEETVHCAIDFNIMLNCTTFSAIRGNQLHILDEHRGSANTEELAQLIRRKFPKNKIVCYPDPSGNRRVTSAAIGTTDFSILKAAGFQVLSRDKSPPIVDSVAAVNRKLLNASGDVDIFIDPRCSGIINSLERTSWLENRLETATIDKSQGVEHFSDGLRYLVEYLWPIKYSKPTVVNSMMF